MNPRTSESNVWRSVAIRYGSAVVLVFIASVLTRWLLILGDPGVSPLFLAAVLLSAWMGGLGPGLLATVLSGAATTFLLKPGVYSLIGLSDVFLRLLVFTTVAVLSGSLNAATRRAAEAFRRARDAAQEANAAKGRFLAMVSHELRTPLTPVAMIADELCERADLPAQVRQQLQTVREGVITELRLIGDLLDLTRASVGKLSLARSNTDLHVPLAMAIAACRNAADARGIVISTELGARDPQINGDPTRLQQIFWNLIRNAIKFTPDGGRIGIRTADERPGQILIEICDNGIGIDPSRLSSIFNAFEQGGPDIAARFGGLGLGLAISQMLVEAHGGSIEAFSEGADRGARFSVRLHQISPVSHTSPQNQDKLAQIPTSAPKW